ncbi:hypothetical protein KHQ82_08460 [Mycoplasmatota bacterium]|nr:hypothetical protein KHQ82_08460 [Mycoplasmatota bacterium]
MNYRIHFFSDRRSTISLKRVYEFFDEEDFIYSQHAKYISFRYENKILENKASFVFSKHNVIPNIYTLNPGFTNINLFVEFPLIISNFYLNEILTIINQLAKMFDLYYYMDLNQDIMPFDKDEIFEKLLDYRDRTLAFEEITRTRGKFLIDSNKLNELCTYQIDSELLSEYFNGEIDVNKYIVMRNLETDELALSVVWDITRPTVFPKYIDYVHVIFEETELTSIVSAKDILPKINRFLAMLPNFVEGTKVLKPGSFIRKAKKVQNKIRKLVISEDDFEIISLMDIIEKRDTSRE